MINELIISLTNFTIQDVKFESKGVTLAGSIIQPNNPFTAVVILHGFDPKQSLNALSIPGLWLFGEKDIQIPVKMCIAELNALKVQGKPYEYRLFRTLGHNTASDDSDTAPFDISIQWIKEKVISY